MTETKEDIQAQIDQLTADWKKRETRFMRTPPMLVGSIWWGQRVKCLPVDEYKAWFLWSYSWSLAITAVGIAGILQESYSGEAIIAAWYYIFIVCLGLIGGMYTRRVRKDWMKTLVAYREAKQDYQRKRAELKDELGALD